MSTDSLDSGTREDKGKEFYGEDGSLTEEGDSHGTETHSSVTSPGLLERQT